MKRIELSNQVPKKLETLNEIGNDINKLESDLVMCDKEYERILNRFRGSIFLGKC